MNRTSIQNQLQNLFRDELETEVPTAETDLMETGYLDSLRFVQLLALLEEKYGLTFDIGDLEFEYFQSIEKIAGFISNKRQQEEMKRKK